MKIEQALEMVQSVLDRGRLSKVQEIVLRQSWEGESYQQIAVRSGYEVGYVTDVGSKLWRLLSEAFGKKVTKNNFYGVLKQQYTAKTASRQTYSASEEKCLEEESIPELSTEEGTLQRQDWGEATDVSVFYGRTSELATLKQWIVQDHCRFVAIVGMGGIGKTALAARVAEQVQNEFKFLIWRSLRNTPPVEELVRGLISFFSERQEVNLPETLESQISCLMEYLRSSRCLLILDNNVLQRVLTSPEF